MKKYFLFTFIALGLASCCDSKLIESNSTDNISNDTIVQDTTDENVTWIGKDGDTIID